MLPIAVLSRARGICGHIITLKGHKNTRIVPVK